MKNRRTSEINASTMADIAFLLLVFFLVATTFLKDKGVEATLPSFYDGPPIKIPDNYVLDIKVNKSDELLVEGEYEKIENLQFIVQDFVLNTSHRKDWAPSSDKAIISLQNDEATSYKTYLLVYSIIRQAYKTMRNEEANRMFKKDYESLSTKERNSIILKLPIKISEADPFVASI